jgi:hypothetical protein
VQALQNGTQCSFQFSGAISNNGDQFALVVLDGDYNGLFPLSLCAVVRCAQTACLDFTLDTNTVFTCVATQCHG